MRTGVMRELVTPTGAAIVSTLCDEFGSQPRDGDLANRIWRGLRRDCKEQPNVVRLTDWRIGRKRNRGNVERSRSAVIEANLDDMNPQIYGYFAEKALGRRGAGCFRGAGADEEESSRNVGDDSMRAERCRQTGRSCFFPRRRRLACEVTKRTLACCRAKS